MPLPCVGSNILAFSPNRKERRSQHRYRIALDLRCRQVNSEALRPRWTSPTEVARGETLDITSRGVRFRVDAAPARDALVELSIAWPARLDGRCALKLIILGRVLRSDTGGTAVKTLCHEFRVGGAIATVAIPSREVKTGLSPETVHVPLGPKDGQGKPTVLLADDDESIRILIAAILSAMGLLVLRARDGQQALLKSQEHNRRIDLLLSDIQMGPDMTGIELAAQLHLERPDTKILLMSGTNFETEVQGAGWSFIRKPFPPDDLKRKVQSLLGAR